MIELAFCEDCGTAQQPRREVCRACLSGRIVPRKAEGGGVLLADTRIHRSLDPKFEARLPLPVGSVKLDAGPVVFAFLEGGVQAGGRVQVATRDEDGASRFVARPS